MSLSPERRTAPKGRRANDSLVAKERDVLSAILDTAGALITVLDASGRIVLFNHACEAITGYTAKQALGKLLWEVSNPPEEAQEVQQFFRTLSGNKFPETHDREWVHRNGERHMINWRNTALFTADGKLDLIIATGFDVTAYRAARAEVEHRKWQLGERVKELRCLYGISRLNEQSELSLHELLQQIVELIPPAWQFPECACACIHVNGSSYASNNYCSSLACQASQIQSGGAILGFIEVCYTQLLPEMGDDVFLPEERSLLDSIAERVGNIVNQHRAAQRIAEYQTQLRSLASELALTSERERHRIAQDLHDQVGHSLASIKFKLSGLRKTTPSGELDDALSLLEQAIQASRNLTFELSPPVLHELGLGAALEWLVHQLRANFGIAGEYIDDRQPKPLTEDLRVELFQAVRELLANVGKHSQASMAHVHAQVEGSQLILEVRDDGIGFDPAKRKQQAGHDGWGLFSIRERLAHLGAELVIQSAPGQGTCITLRAPLAAIEQEQAPQVSHPATRDQASTAPISILLADDQALTRAGLRSLIERYPDMRVVAEAGDGEEAVGKALSTLPDVVVMDIAMPKLNGIEATRRIIAECPSIKVIALSMHADGQYVLEMLRAGASGYLLKDCAEEDLAQAIRIVDANLTFLSPGLADNVAADFVSGRPVRTESGPSLTPRELEVLRMLASGVTAKAAAVQLKVSLKTIETHRQHVMEKLGIHTIAGLTRYAIREKLIELED